MPIFIYQAVDQKGQKVKEKIEAPSKDVVVSMLQSKNLYIYSVTEESLLNKEIKFGNNGAFSAKDVGLFARQFAILLKSGISIALSLDILKTQIENKKMAVVVAVVHEAVQKGDSLSVWLKNTKRFPDLFVNTIAAGETGGNMEEVMDRMANYYERTSKTTSKVKSALIYPCIVLLVTLVVSYILITKVVPTFVEMFDSMDSELPGITKALIAIADFLNAHWILIFAILAAIIVLVVYYIRTPHGKFRKDLIMLRLPVVRDLIQKSAIARFARTMSIMLKTGIPMINALEYSSNVLGNTVIMKAMVNVKDRVEAGSNLSVPIDEMHLFPKLVSSMIRIGEETGSLDEMLNKCADFYDDEVETAAGRLTSMIEPFVIIILALVVGTIVMAIITPMFEMYSNMM